MCLQNKKNHIHSKIKFFKKFESVSLKTKLILFFVIISLVPTFIIGLVSYKVSESVVKSKEIEKNIMNLKVVNSFVSNYLDGKKSLGLRLASNKYVISFMKNNGTQKNSLTQGNSEINILLSEYGNSDGIKSIFIFDSHGGMVTNNPGDLVSYNEIDSNVWYSNFISLKTYI